MKTILRIIIVLLVASVVAGALTLTVNNTSLASGFAEGERPTITSSDGQIIQPMERPDGGEREEGGSIAGSLGGVIVTLTKLTGVTVLILALQKGFDLINNMKMKPAQQ